MAVQWGLAGDGFDALQSLQVAGQAQQRALVNQQRQQEQARVAQVARVSGDALNGDPNARAQLAYIDRDFFQSLDKAGHEKAKGDIATLGQFALLADTPEKWDSYVGQYVQMGHPEAAQYLGKYSPQARAAVIAQAGKAEDLLNRMEPKYLAVGENGIVNVRDPAALAQVAGQQPQSAPATPQGGNGGLEAQAAAAIAAGADPVAVRARLAQMQGGAPSQGGATFP